MAQLGAVTRQVEVPIPQTPDYIDYTIEDFDTTPRLPDGAPEGDSQALEVPARPKTVETV